MFRLQHFLWKTIHKQITFKIYFLSRVVRYHKLFSVKSFCLALPLKLDSINWPSLEQLALPTENLVFKTDTFFGLVGISYSLSNQNSYSSKMVAFCVVSHRLFLSSFFTSLLISGCLEGSAVHGCINTSKPSIARTPSLAQRTNNPDCQGQYN